MKRTQSALCALFVMSVLTACGGGDNGPLVSDSRSFKSVVSFGDSLSDVGTFAPNAATVQPQGVTAKFTTNGVGQTIWVENIAASLGTTISPYESALTPPNIPGTYTILGGNGYATGGARAIRGPDQTDKNLNLAVGEQVDAYLARNGSFRQDQLVLFWIGGNDVAFALQSGAGAAYIQQAVAAAVGQIARIAANGARYIIVNNVPDVGKTPLVASLGATASAGATLLSQGFNAGLAAGIKSLNNPNIVLVDVYSLNADAAANPAKYGLVNTTTPACANIPTAGPFNPVNNSLFCNTSTLVAANANNTYLYSDVFHPTSGVHKLISNTAINAARAQGVPQL